MESCEWTARCECCRDRHEEDTERAAFRRNTMVGVALDGRAVTMQNFIGALKLKNNATYPKHQIARDSVT